MEGGVRHLDLCPGEPSAAPIRSCLPPQTTLPQRVLVLAGDSCSVVRVGRGGLEERVDRREKDPRPRLDPRRLRGSLDECSECL